MARPIRIEYDGAVYHVTSRGNARKRIYKDDVDRLSFLDILAEVNRKYNWLCHAYCLMDNHYHLWVETPDGNLSKGMRQLNGVYTQRFNRKRKRVGHVFQGRYKAVIVQKDSYLLELARYIVLNPVRAEMVRSARDWPGSSSRATADLAPGPEWLTTTSILSAFGQRRAQAMTAYRDFVAAGRNQPSPWASLKHQIYLGSDKFVEKMQSKLDANQALSEVPTAHRRQIPKPLEHF